MTIPDMAGRGAARDALSSSEGTGANVPTPLDLAIEAATTGAPDPMEDLRRRAEEAERRELRNRIAVDYGISAADRDLLLTGADEAALLAQASRLAGDPLQGVNVATREGAVRETGSGAADSEMNDFTAELFGRD